VPDATSAPTGTFLKEDGTWAVAGVGSVTNFSTVSTAYPGITTTVTNPTSTPELVLGLGTNAAAGKYLDGGTGDWVTLPPPGTGTVTSSGNLAVTPTGGIAGQFLDYTGNWSSPGGGVTDVTFNSAINPSAGDALTITPTTGSVVVSANVFGGNGMHGIVSSGSSSNDALFLKGDGSWDTPGGIGATITSNQTTTTNATTTVFALGATPSGSSVNFVDAFIDGVYQETTTYSVSGQNLTFNSPIPSGVTVETKTTADYNVGAAVQTVNGLSGDVSTKDVPVVKTNASPEAVTTQNQHLYVLYGSAAVTLTLPSSPAAGDYIKISNLSTLTTNVVAQAGTGEWINGVNGNLNLTASASLELIYSGNQQPGWVIIGSN
jgi:hypothetical protein